MSQTSTALSFTLTTLGSPRARRGEAGVLAQYIQDLSHPNDTLEPAAA